jgi:glycosyltransferase involved in cell wall biosynthesis
MQDYLSASTARRVLVVSNLFPPHGAGDAEVIAYRQARQLRARGHVVSVFAGRVAPPSHAGRLEVNDEDGLRVWRTPVVSFEPDDDFCTPTIGARLQSVLDAEQPDLVHFHNLSGLGFSLVPLVKRYGLPAIVTLHDHAGYCYRATALRRDGSPCREPEECALACSGAVRPREVGLALPMRLRRDYVAWALAHADRLIAPSDALAAAFRTARVADDARLQFVSNGAHGDRSSEEAALNAIEAVYEAVSRVPRPPCSDRPLVLCAGDCALPQVAEICNSLYRLERGSPGVRLMWHGWADPGTWTQAALLWNWGPGDASYAAMQRALRAGVPVLAPTSCIVAAAVENSFGAALTYDTFLEGMLALARVPHDAAALRVLRRDCREAAAMVAAGAPPESYRLPTPVLSA